LWIARLCAEILPCQTGTVAIRFGLEIHKYVIGFLFIFKRRTDASSKKNSRSRSGFHIGHAATGSLLNYSARGIKGEVIPVCSIHAAKLSLYFSLDSPILKE
jgi:hypothetical protein